MTVSNPAVATGSAAAVSQAIAQLMTPLEQHASEKLRRLRGTSAFLRDLQSVEDKYALECAKLPFAIPDKMRARLRRPQPTHKDEQLPEQLGRVCFGLEAFVHQHNDAKARLAKSLALAVVTPMEHFVDQQVKQTKCLLAEIAQALQNEQKLHTQCQLSLRVCALESSSSGVKTEQRGNQGDGEREVDPRGQQQQLKALFKRRQHERAVVRERLDELHLIEQQQLAVTNSILERVIESYSRLIAHTNSLISELQATLKPSSPSTADKKPIRCGAREHAEGDNDDDDDDEQSWKAFLKQCERHVVMTEWMNSFFTQLFVVEENMIKRLQAMLKLHPNSDVFTKTTGTAGFTTSMSANRDGASVPVISDFMHFHKLLTVNLMDPISRTLKFSKQKQDKIRKELLESLDETARLVMHTRKRVKERELKHLKQLSNGSVVPVSGLTAGDASSSGAGASFSGQMADAMRLNLSNFGLRSAVVTMSKTQRGGFSGDARKPRTSLTDDDDEVNGDQQASGHSSVEKQPLVTGVDKELNDARVYLLSLQRNEVEQRREIVKTLRSTSLLGVKTMELMTNDYLKHVGNALAAIKQCIDRYDATRATGSASSTAPASGSDELPSKWHSFIHFAPEDADLKKTIGDVGDDEGGPELDDDCDDANQDDEEARSDVSKRDSQQRAQQQQQRSLTLSRRLLGGKLADEPRNKALSASAPLVRDASCKDSVRTPLESVKVAATKAQSLLRSSLERVCARVFQSEVSTLLAFAVAMALLALSALAVWVHLARLQQSWEDIAVLQRSSTAGVESLLQQLLAVQHEQGGATYQPSRAIGDFAT